MTLTQYKKAIKSLSRDELETHLFEMFSTSKVFKDVESSYWSEGYNDTLLSNLQKQLGKVFWKMQFSLNECKGVLNEYLNKTVDEGTKALMHLAFATEAAKFSATYGDFGARYYNNLMSSAKKFMDYARVHPDFFRLHETEFEKIIVIADSLGYGVSYNLEYLLANVRAELG